MGRVMWWVNVDHRLLRRRTIGMLITHFASAASA
jgi:uncharacterized membrane protein YecN with MAPEG domain